MTLRDAFFSLLASAKFLRFDMVKFEHTTFGSHAASCILTTQACTRASPAVGLIVGSRVSTALRNCLASGDTFFHSFLSNCGRARLTESNTATVSLPEKGGDPQRRMYVMTPMLQTSLFS